MNLDGFRFIILAQFKTMMMSSLGNVAFDLFGCLYEIVLCGVLHDLQSIPYSTKLDEDLVTEFLQSGKFVLYKSKVQKIS
jgi:hypothetical protein